MTEEVVAAAEAASTTQQVGLSIREYHYISYRYRYIGIYTLVLFRALLPMTEEVVAAAEAASTTQQINLSIREYHYICQL